MRVRRVSAIILVLLALATLFVFFSANDVLAQQSCGSAVTQIVGSCDSNCNPVTFPVSYNCYNRFTGECEGYVEASYCYQPTGGECKLVRLGLVAIPCGTQLTPTGGGGGSCESPPAPYDLEVEWQCFPYQDKVRATANSNVGSLGISVIVQTAVQLPPELAAHHGDSQRAFILDAVLKDAPRLDCILPAVQLLANRKLPNFAL